MATSRWRKGGSQPGRPGSSSQVESPLSRNDAVSACDLVKSTDGEIDWKTLANIITASLLGEVVCASYADYKYGKRTKNFKPDIEWMFSYEENDVLVFSKHMASEQKVLSYMGRSVVDFPVWPVASVLQNLDCFHLWNKFLVDSTLVKVISESAAHKSIIAYFLHETKKCFVRTKRDMVLFIHNQCEANRFVQAAISVDHPDCPAVHDVTRAECCLGSGWVVEPYEGQRSKSLVSFVCNVDMKGLISPVVLNQFLQRQALAIHYMRQCIAEEMKKHNPLSPARSLLRTHANSPAESRTSRHSGAIEREEEGGEREEGCLSPTEFTRHGLGSIVVETTSSKQYEEPVGISEFIGHNTAPRAKRRQRRRHRCCQGAVEPQGGGGEGGGGPGGGGGGGSILDSFFSSGSCEECRARAGSMDTIVGWGTGRNRYSNYKTR